MNSVVFSFKKMAVALSVTATLCTAGLAGAEEQMDYKAFLAKSPLGVLATVEGNQPRTRVFQLLRIQDGKFWFCTGASKDVYKQLQANNRVSFCVWNPETNVVLNLDGPVSFVEDKNLSAELLAENPGIKAIYKSADNPEFKVFYLEPTTITSFDFVKGKTFLKQAPAI